MHPFRSAGILDTARSKGDTGHRGRPVAGEGSGLNVACRRRLERESDRGVRPLRPGNAGGGKDPDFRCASQDGEVAVIGDEPGNTINDRTCRRLLYQGVKDRKDAAQNPLAAYLLSVCSMVKPIGKPDAGKEQPTRLRV